MLKRTMPAGAQPLRLPAQQLSQLRGDKAVRCRAVQTPRRAANARGRCEAKVRRVLGDRRTRVRALRSTV